MKSTYTIVNIFTTDKIRPKELNVVIGVEDIDSVLQWIVYEEEKTVKQRTSAPEMGSFAVFQNCFGNELSFISEEKTISNHRKDYC